MPARHSGSNINAQIVLLRSADGSWNPHYLKVALEDEESQREMKSLETGTALRQLPVGRLKEVTIKRPPKERQDMFAAFVQQVDKLKVVIRKSIEKLELLKASLMQEYFG